MEFVESLDDGALASIVADWIDANPLAAPGAVRFPWRPYNLSLRVSAWARELARRGGRLEPAFRARMAASLAAQLRFLAGHLETDLRGNHLVKNLKALLWGGTVFGGPEAEAWRTLGSNLLASELEEQVLADGCHYERSPPYHGQVLADLIEVRALLPAGSLRDRLDEALGRMVSVARLLAHPDGLPAGFNDGGLGDGAAAGRARRRLHRGYRPHRRADRWAVRPSGRRLLGPRGAWRAPSRRLRPAWAKLPAGARARRYPLARVVDRRSSCPGRPGHLPVRRRPAPAAPAAARSPTTR